MACGDLTAANSIKLVPGFEVTHDRVHPSIEVLTILSSQCYFQEGPYDATRCGEDIAAIPWDVNFLMQEIGSIDRRQIYDEARRVLHRRSEGLSSGEDGWLLKSLRKGVRACVCVCSNLFCAFHAIDANS